MREIGLKISNFLGYLGRRISLGFSILHGFRPELKYAGNSSNSLKTTQNILSVAFNRLGLLAGNLSYSRDWIKARSQLLLTILCASLLLSGCVEYDVGINFESQTHGEIVQHVKLGEELKSFGGEPVQNWLERIERRSQQLGGRTKRLSQQEIKVAIPFNNGAELEEKFNQFFNPDERDKSRSAKGESELRDIKTQLGIIQNNWILALRNQLSFDIDLRSLGVVSSEGNVLLSPDLLLDLQFRLNTPWGARTIETSADAISPEIRDGSKQLVWTLKPGQLNHIEAIFWVPSPIGIGALAIILLVATGSFLKYQLFPAIGIGTRQKPVARNKVTPPAQPSA